MKTYKKIRRTRALRQPKFYVCKIRRENFRAIYYRLVIDSFVIEALESRVSSRALYFG